MGRLLIEDGQRRQFPVAFVGDEAEVMALRRAVARDPELVAA